MVNHSQQKKTTASKFTKTKEEELRRRLQKLFKNKPPMDKESNREKKKDEQWKSQEMKSNFVKKKVNNFPEKKSNDQSDNVNKRGNVQQQKQQRNKQTKQKKQNQSNGYSTPLENGVKKKLTKRQKKKKDYLKTQETSNPPAEVNTKNNANPELPKQKKKKTRKRKAAETKSAPPHKQKFKQQVELPPDVLNIVDTSEFSFSDFSDEHEEPDTVYAGYSTDDFTGSEYSFSNFQDDNRATSNGYMHDGNLEDDFDDNDYNYEDDSNMYSDDDDCSWTHDDNYDDDETYSDIDESDFGDEDAYSDYAEDINDDDFQVSGTDDEDYKLPEHVPEDLIIHRGTADKRDLFESDEVVFSEHCDGAQLVELRHQVIIKRITQPEEYHRTALEELNKKEIDVSPQFKQQQNESATEESGSESDCPKLVPIVDEDGFQMWSEELNSSESCESFNSSEYEECSDDDSSFVSIDVNSKYLHKCEEDYETTTNEDEEDAHQKSKREKMSAEVIEAINTEDVCMVSHFDKESNNENSVSEVDMPPSKKFKEEKKGKGTVICTKVNAMKLKAKEQPKESIKTVQETKLDRDVELTFSPTKLKAKEQPKESMKTVQETKLDRDVELTFSPTKQIENVKNNSDIFNTCAEESTTPMKANTKMKAASQTFAISRPSMSCRSIFCNAIDSNDVLVLLRESLSIYGTLKLSPIAGSIEIYGYAPKHGEELEIFSTRGLSSVQIEPKPSKQTSLKALNKELQLLEEHFSKVEISKIKENFNPLEDALILLKRNETRKKLVATFKKYMNENVFPNMNSIQADRPFYASECRLRCVINATDEYDKPLKMNTQWEQLQVQSNSKILLIGGKSVGKSTLLRVLVNRHLAYYPRMLVIDLDIGQQELFVPQTISASLVNRPLLGPGFFLNQQPVQSFAIGHSNIVLCPHRYMQAVQQLINFCHGQPELAQLPWFINTMGYNKGFGAELVSVICDYLQPTDVVQLHSNKDINNYDYLMKPHVVASIPRNIYSGKEYQLERMQQESSTNLNFQLHVFNSAITQESRYQRDWEMSSKDLRYANMLSRLSDVFVGHADWFSDCKPICASLDSLKFLNLLSTGFTREQILKSIEANLVYLCRQDDNETVVRCFGIGVVRAIDYHINQIYLLPALPQHLMTEVNCLAIGEMPLPTSMLTNQGPKVTNTAPFLYNTIRANASKSIKQIFYRPPQFLGGKHKNTN